MPRVASLKFINDYSCECKECGVVVAHRHDMRRHMRLHESGKTQGKYQCPWVGCTFKTLQKTNLDTHYRIHSQDKSKACPDCDFKTCDPASLTRHRKRLHNYVPRPRKARAPKKQRNGLVDSSDISDSPSPTSCEYILDLSSSSSSPDVAPTMIDESGVKPYFPGDHHFISDDLSFESGSVYHRRDIDFSYWDEFRRSPEPRPLLPAAESSPPLEKFGALQFDPSEFELSLLLGSQKMAVLPHIDSEGLWQSSVGALQNRIQFPALQQPPTSYDFALKHMAELGPSMPMAIPECDFRTIFGLDYDNFLDQNQIVRPLSPWSNAGSASPAPASPSSSPSPPLVTGSLLAELYSPLDF